MSSNIVQLPGRGLAIVSARIIREDEMEIKIRFVNRRVDVEKLSDVIVRIISAYLTGIDILSMAIGINLLRQ